jgi:predicted secreted acid phosphatase
MRIEEYISPIAAAIPNLGLVKAQVREYYGDHLDDNGTHQFSLTSAWANDVSAVIALAKQYVKERLENGDLVNPALVLDLDDTALSTYPYLANTGFGSRQNHETLPAIPQVLDLARYAHARGAAIFYISVRPSDRYDHTVANLAQVGFPDPTEIFLRRHTPPFPAYLTSATCPPEEFKTATRKHIEGRGYCILVTIGDQYSDLRGGYAERAFKLPNPMYFT